MGSNQGSNGMESISWKKMDEKYELKCGLLRQKSFFDSSLYMVKVEFYQQL